MANCLREGRKKILDVKSRLQIAAGQKERFKSNDGQGEDKRETYKCCWL